MKMSLSIHQKNLIYTICANHWSKRRRYKHKHKIYLKYHILEGEKKSVWSAGLDPIILAPWYYAHEYIT